MNELAGHECLNNKAPAAGANGDEDKDDPEAGIVGAALVAATGGLSAAPGDADTPPQPQFKIALSGPTANYSLHFQNDSAVRTPWVAVWALGLGVMVYGLGSRVGPLG